MKKKFQKTANIMDEKLSTIEKTVLSDYKYGFVTDIEADEAPRGLNEDMSVLFLQKKMNRNGCWNGD